MVKNKTINVKGSKILIISSSDDDFISLTDIARYKDPEHIDDIIKNWMRNRNTIELLGFWEMLYNPDFKPVEFDGFRKQAGLNSFVMTPKKWIESTNAEGNICDMATIEQLKVLSNLESINAVLIHQNLPEADRLKQLNGIAITQMKSLIRQDTLKRIND